MPTDFESAWKLARAQYWLGHQRPARARSQGGARSRHRGGAPGGRPQRRSRPKGISGSPPTWARSPSRSACARASAIAGRFATSSRRCSSSIPRFCEGSADRALGRWYYKVPGLFGGDKKKSEAAPAQGARLQPAERHHASVPRRDADRARSAGTKRARSSKPRSPRPTIQSGRRRIGGSSSRRERCSRARSKRP